MSPTTTAASGRWKSTLKQQASNKSETPNMVVSTIIIMGSLGTDSNYPRFIYNDDITIWNIPLEAYDYVVNGKSAIEWVMERYQVTTHKESGIVNDPNLWCDEHDTPRYIIDLLKRLVTLSLETRRIVKALPILKL